MTPEWDEKAVFLAALDLDPSQRDAYLQQACPNEAARERIRALLRHPPDERTFALPRPEPDPAGAEPTQIDEFLIVRRLGAGAMGVVYLAHDTILGRRVAIKVLAGHLTGSEESVARFRDEARNAASLEHPGIVSVYKFGFDGTHHYIASEFVAGRTLADVIDHERQQRPPGAGTGAIRQWHRRCAEIVAAIADALDYSHRANVIHRDVKPSNVLVDAAGTPRLTDFGIAIQAMERTQTQTEIIGSCYYMSPEQAAIAQTRVDRRSDIFSLGVVMFELLALRRPFEGHDVPQILRAVISDPAPRLRSIDRLIPRDLETICAKALEKDRTQRYPTAAHMAADLRCFLAGDPILAHPPGLARRSSRWLRRHQRAVAVTSCVGLLATLGAVLWISQARRLASLAWVRIDSPIAGCSIWAQRVHPDTLELEPAARLLGDTPAGDRHLPTGDYRITIVAPDGSWFAEFGAPLRLPGRANRTTLHAGPAWDGSPVRWNPLSASDGPARLSARNVPTASATNPRDMVLIGAGDYPFGWRDPAAENPSVWSTMKQTAVEAFFIDRREVSNAEFIAFANQTGYPLPEYLKAMPPDSPLASLPVVNVTMTDAEAYARWMGKRLPTMYEWQAAACTRRGFRFPDDDPSVPSRTANPADLDGQIGDTDDGHRRDAFYARYMVPVASGAPDALGLLHTFDNARELTSTIQGSSVVMTGPNFRLPPAQWDLRKVIVQPLGGFDSIIGFRCAKSAQPPVQAQR